MATKGRYWLSDYAVKLDPTTCRHAQYFRLEWHSAWRVVECDHTERDTLQCTLCGETKETRCTFDDGDYS